MLRLVWVIFALVLGLAFHSRNHQAVTLDLYTKSFELPLSWVAVGALCVGALLGALVLLPRLLRLQRALRREQKRANIPQAPAPTPTPLAAATAPEAPDGH